MRRTVRMLGLLLAILLATAAFAVAFGAAEAPVWLPGGPAEDVASPVAVALAVELPEVWHAPRGIPSAAQPRRELAAGTRVRLPRLHIDLPLLEGDLARDVGRQATPTGAAFHLPGTALPGEAGNAYVYAHARPGMFLSLRDVRLGDAVELIAPSGERLTYRVTRIDRAVRADDLAFLQPSDDERVTLQTSTGPHPNDPRFVVVAAREAP